MAKTCAICGKPSGMYPLCNACFKLRDAGEVVKCEECGTWHKVDEPCNCEDLIEEFEEEEITGQCLLCDNEAGPYLFCKSCYHKYKNNSINVRITNCKDFEIINEYENKTESADTASDLTCIICGEPSNGKHFCTKCYHKYKNKIIYLKIKDCVEYDPLGYEYESDLICEDGHIVKSEPERNIDNWLFNHDIKHIYERTYQVSETVKLRPDWCLPGYIKDEDGHPVDVYVEYWGIEGSAKYENIKNYKLPIYQEQGLTLVNINAEQDKRDISAALDWKIGQRKNIKPYQINFLK